MKTPLRLLLVEDNEDDALLVLAELRRSGYEPAFERVETAAALQEALRRQSWEVVISDFRMPTFSGPAALQVVRASGLDLPFIVVSGTVGEDMAVEMLKAGANDYLLKDRLGRLGNTVAHELENRQLRQESRRAQQQLLLQTAALQTTANAVVITDRAGLLLWVNPAFTALTGYEEAEVIGQTPRVLKSGQHDAAFYAAFWKTISAGQTWRGEFINRRKDGSLYLDEHTVTPVHDAGGRITHFIGIMHDVTARKRAEEALRESEARARMAITVANIGFWDWNLLSNEVFFSREWKSQLGYAEAEIPGRFEEFQSRLHPDDLEPTLAKVRAYLESATPGYTAEFRLRHRNGSYRWIFSEAQLARDAGGLPVRMVGCHLDFTERKQAEVMLHESKRFALATIDALSAHLCVLDEAGTVLTTNAAWRRFAEANRDSLQRVATGANYLEACAAARGPEAPAAHAFAAGLRAVIAGERTEFALEYPCHSPTERRWFVGRVTRFTGAGPGRVVVAHEDISERKRVEDELRWQTAFLEAQVDSSFDGLLVVDGQGRKLLQNARFNELWKIPSHLIDTENDAEQVRFATSQTKHPQQFAERVAHLYAHPEESGRDEIELIDGTVMDRYSAPVRGKDGQHYGRIWSFRDVTQRKHAEQRLADALHYTQTILTASPVGILTYTAAGDMVSANAAAARLVGATPEQLLAQNFRQLESWQRAGLLDAADRAVATGQEQELEPRFVTTFGREVWLAWRFVPFQHGGAPHLLAMFSDVAERKRAEAALRESRHVLEQAQLVGHIGSWVSEPGPPARLVWSAETARIFGVAPGGFDGRPESFNALVHPEDREAVARAAQAALAGGPAYDLNHRIVRPDGQVRWVHEQADVERDPAGRPVRLVGVVQDITDRKHLEEQLRQAQKMEAIGQLAGGIAHDFNNILGSILGNAELIRALPAGGPEAGECLADILTGCRRAADLVGQILAFSRRQESRRQPMPLQPVVREVLKLLRATVPASVEFRAQLASVPTVLADPSEIHQVAMNLCTNAWHALQGRAGIITVELAEQELDEAFTRRHPDLRPGRYVCLTVADSGCGMDEATLGRIFEPFFTTKPVGTGTGLGLSVVHGIMKNHDGGIVVHSRPGEGATFQLYFPVFATEAAAAAPAPRQVPRGAGEHILFVDDEEPLARMGSRVLERLGYRVSRFTSPAGALAAFRAEPDGFDLVVVDHNMPEMNGTEFGARVLETRPGQRLILTTGYSAVVTEAAARELGFRALMPKPYDLGSLGETVHRVLHPADVRQ